MNIQSLKEKVHAFEREHILAALDAEQDCRARAATRLGMKRSTLVEKMRRLNILELRPSPFRQNRLDLTPETSEELQCGKELI